MGRERAIMYYNLKTNKVSVSRPYTLEVAGGVISNPSNTDYHNAGWYKFIRFVPPVGYVKVPSTRELMTNVQAFTVTEVFQVELAPDPVYTMSKLKLVQAMDSLGLLDDFLSALQSDATAKLMWDVSVVIDSDNPLVVNFINANKTSLGINDQDIKDMFENCISDLGGVQ